jgi:hypothetical protein
MGIGSGAGLMPIFYFQSYLELGKGSGLGRGMGAGNGEVNYYKVGRGTVCGATIGDGNGHGGDGDRQCDILETPTVYVVGE